MSRVKNIKRHLKIKFRERFNFKINEELHGELVKTILKVPFDYWIKQTLRVNMIPVTWREMFFFAVYDKKRKLVITVMNIKVKDSLEETVNNLKEKYAKRPRRNDSRKNSITLLSGETVDPNEI